MPASGFAREVRLETKKVHFMVKREQPASDPARKVRFGIKKVLSCEQEEATMPEATQARQVHLWGQEGAF